MEELEESQEASGKIPGGQPGQLAMGPLKMHSTKLGWGGGVAFGLHIVEKDRWRTQQYAERVDHFEGGFRFGNFFEA
jgi:hypothetical protein